jgi:hypothetical protein
MLQHRKNTHCKHRKTCNATSKNVLQHQKNMCCNIKNYVPQHQKLCATTSKNIYCNITKSTMKHRKWDHSENICCNNPKIPLRHSKIICCNIKKPLATRRKRQKGVRNSKEMGSRCRLLQPWPITSDLVGGRREGPQSSPEP